MALPASAVHSHADQEQVFRWLKQLATDDLDHVNELLQKILCVPDIVAILPACLLSRDDDIRRCAAFVFGLMGTAECVLPLLKSMQQDLNAEVRLNASAALRNFELPWVAAALWGEDQSHWPRDDADKWVQHTEWQRRWYFTLVCVVTRDESWVPFLQQLAQDDSETVVRCSAIAALAYFPRELSESILAGLLSDVNDFVRIEAITALTLLKAVSTVPLLLKQLDAFSEHVRVASLTALAQMGDQHSLPVLLKKMADPVPMVRINVGMAIFEIALRTGYRDALMIHGMIKALADPDPYVVRNAIRTLGRIGDHTAVTEMISLLKKEKTPAVKVNIVQALGQLQDPRAFKILAKMVASESAEVRLEAVKSLRLLDDPKAFGVLLSALNDPSVVIKEQAAYALGFMGNKKAIKKLEKIREQHPYGRIHQVATRAIDRLLGFD